MKTNIIQNTLVPFAMCFCLALALYPNTSLDFDKYSTEGIELEFVKPHSNEDLASLDLKKAAPSSNYTPVLGKNFEGFKEAVGFKESGGDYFTVNTYGYLGKYQFGAETLKLIGVYNTDVFMSSPKLQEKAFIANTQRNKWILRKDIERFEGQMISGIKVTESGILAAAHLAGPGSVKKFLRSYGKKNFKDGYGSTLSSYMKKFSGYDTSEIEPDRKAQVRI
ncbi:MAG: peptidoglycan-binding protein LysM [Bacteroidota bacterium]